MRVLRPEDKQLSIWSIYIIENRFGHWYTGITTDVAKRFNAHQIGKGAKNLKGKGPLKLVFEYEVGSKSLAAKLEWQIKQLSKPQKVRFVESLGEDTNDTIKSLMKVTIST